MVKLAMGLMGRHTNQSTSEQCTEESVRILSLCLCSSDLDNKDGIRAAGKDDGFLGLLASRSRALWEWCYEISTSFG